MIYYKIRHKVTGLYSKGGTWVSSDGTGMWWSKVGKTWSSIGTLRSHLTLVMSEPRRGVDMSNWEVVTHEVRETQAQPVHEVLTPKALVKLLSR